MLPDETRRRLQHVALAGMAASLPLLYVGAVTLESGAVTAAGLGVAGCTAILAWVAFWRVALSRRWCPW